MMKIHDITREISPGGAVYPRDTVPSFQTEVGTYRITRLVMSSHTGTHIDAPSHYIPGGGTVDEIPLEKVTGRVRVIDLAHVRGAITPADLSGRAPGQGAILLKTWYSSEPGFLAEYPHLLPETADFIVTEGIHCIGVDTPSVEVFGGDGSVHRKLLGNGVAVIEFLDLSGVPEGDYLMAALPLRLKGLDGSPARVVLFEGCGGVEHMSPVGDMFEHRSSGRGRERGVK